MKQIRNHMKTIPGFPNYAVTDSGEVWSKPRKRVKGRWLKPGIRHDGGQQVTLSNNTGRSSCKIHHLVLEVYIGSRLQGMECRHLDGNPANNRLENLRWGTTKENHQDAVRHGTHRSLHQNGEKNPVSKLSDYDRRLIIYQYTTGLFTQTELAQEYNVSDATICRLVNGKQWPFVKVPHIQDR